MRYHLRLPRLFRHPVLQVIVLGTASWLVYLHLTLTYPLATFILKYPLTDFGRANNWSLISLEDFVLSILGAFALYLLAFQVVRRHPDRRTLLWLTLAFALLCAVTLLVIYPITATDIFEYSFHSRILTRYGQNPLTTPPIAFKGDPFLKTVNWMVQPSPYGPLWVILTVPGSLLAANDLVLNILMMKGLAVIFYLGCVVMVAAILRVQDPARKLAGTLLFAWNPLILFEAPGNGHNGIIMMFFVLLAIYMLVNRRWMWVLPILGASVLVKYVSALLLIPFLVYCMRAQTGMRNRLVFLVQTLALSGILFAIIELPFFAVPTGLLDEADFYSLLAVPTLVYHFLKGIHGDKMAKTLTFAASSLLYIGLYSTSLPFLRSLQRHRNLLILTTWLVMAYLMVGSMHFQPWFAVWPITLGIWVHHPLTRRVLLTFSLSALLSYAANFFWVWNYRSWSNIQVNVMFVLVIFGPPLVIGIAGGVWQYILSATRQGARLEFEDAQT
ncbi:MAG: hypothetical protein ACM3S0_14440 [Acidobacteriota bacterium]